eukprot:g46740.t1
MDTVDHENLFPMADMAKTRGHKFMYCAFIKDGQLSISLYRNPTDNLTMLHFPSFHPKHIKTAIPYGQAPYIREICLVEEEHDRNLKFQHATVKNRSELLTRQTRDMSDRVLFIIQYFLGVEKLHCLQHIIDDDEHLAKIFPMDSMKTTGVGNFNVHHQEWLGSNTTDRVGQVLKDIAARLSLQQHIPNSTITIKPGDQLWFNAECRRACEQQHPAQLKLRCQPGEATKQNYLCAKMHR